LRLAALGALTVVLLACSNSSAGPVSVASPSAARNAASTPAADLRVQLDLLLAEQVMIVAKESAAATNHSDDYASYTALLTTNSIDLAGVMRRAVGSTGADQFAQAWNTQNGYLVDYAIGVVTHNDDKANAAMSGLTGKFVPQFAQLISGLSGLPLDAVTQLTSQQALEDKTFIDDVFAQNYVSFYSHLHKAYAHTSRFGDALAVQIAQKFPDKFPGDPSQRAADVRVSFNQLLEERSYLATMVTDAVVNGRTAERPQALAGVAANSAAIGAALKDQQFTQAWSQEALALEAYAASNDATTKRALTETFVSQLASVMGISQGLIANQVTATIRVVDDQRAKSSKTIAGDDRAAATSMQPIADSIQG
jgi:hypothetical protein